jgi:3'(2'), 5'-bisphosphate nucleotidase
MENEELLKKSKIIEKILRECGSMLLVSFSNGEYEGEWQGEQFKAKVDLLAHNFLLKQLGYYFPKIPVVSEEDQTIIETSFEEYFVIDPLDGTASFVGGYSSWVTQIAYIYKNNTVLSGIYAPVSNEYFSAITGYGAYLNDSKLNVSNQLGTPVTIIDNYPEATGITLELKNSLAIKNYYELGSISLKICKIADSTADIFFKNMSPRDWDLAAPELVLKEAGGVIHDVFGKNFCFGLPGRSHNGIIAASNSKIADLAKNWFLTR